MRVFHAVAVLVSCRVVSLTPHATHDCSGHQPEQQQSSAVSRWAKEVHTQDGWREGGLACKQTGKSAVIITGGHERRNQRLRSAFAQTQKRTCSPQTLQPNRENKQDGIQTLILLTRSERDRERDTHLSHPLTHRSQCSRASRVEMCCRISCSSLCGTRESLREPRPAASSLCCRTLVAGLKSRTHTSVQTPRV